MRIPQDPESLSSSVLTKPNGEFVARPFAVYDNGVSSDSAWSDAGDGHHSPIKLRGADFTSRLFNSAAAALTSVAPRMAETTAMRCAPALRTASRF